MYEEEIKNGWLNSEKWLEALAGVGNPSIDH